ncbi:MAG: hypothetical protein JW958_13735 [Candidatus Eisenbacteria bacterium]|nr:hypothetical protein [Candidatus Eisenbacteria bacterium]
MNVVLVGGGQAATVILKMFHGDPEIQVQAVVDLNNAAPGMVLARKLGISTSNNSEGMIRDPNVNAVLDITGSAKVRQNIVEMLRPDQDFISGGGVKMMSDLLERSSRAHCMEVANRLAELMDQMRATMENIDRTSDGTEGVLREIKLLAINGNIEAARAGDAGAAFSVVVERLQDLVSQVGDAVDRITVSSHETHDLLANLEKTEQSLRENDKMASAI